MMEPAGEDYRWLERYAREGDQAAFSQVVRRHVDLVYSAALRRVGEREMAEDVTQAVFVILARKAKGMRDDRALSAWLLRCVKYAAANAVKMEKRRRRHEQAAGEARRGAGACSSDPTEVLVWQEVAGELNDAVLKLPAMDRRVVLLRYFEDWPIREIAMDLRVSEGAAKQRLGRALEKLRRRLEKRGMSISAMDEAGLEALLARQVVRAARPGLAQSACAAAMGGGVGTGITIAKGAMAMMTWSKAKIAAAVVAVAMVGGGGVIGVNRALAQQSHLAAKAQAPKAPVPKKQKPANPITVESVPPVVVATEPRAGSRQVDAEGVTEIKVTFSKEMADGSWSWSTLGEENFPETTGKPHYLEDKRTCVLPVRLQPGRTYAIWLNSENFGNFKDAERRSAVPYLLVFETKK